MAGGTAAFTISANACSFFDNFFLGSLIGPKVFMVVVEVIVVLDKLRRQNPSIRQARARAASRVVIANVYAVWKLVPT